MPRPGPILHRRAAANGHVAANLDRPGAGMNLVCALGA